MARNIWPLVQNRNEEEWALAHSDEWRFPLGRVDFCNSAESVCLYVCPRTFVNNSGTDGPRFGRDKHQKMRQSAGTTMAFVTWRHVPRGTCHVPPREPLAKPFAPGYSPNGKSPRVQTFRVGAPRCGMCAFVSDDSIGSKLCPQGTISFFSLMPSSSETLRPIDTKLMSFDAV